jgi:hypothetical protein
VPTDNAEFEVKGQGEPSVVAAPRRKRLARVWQWFWLGDEVKVARSTVRQPDVTLDQRAHLAAEIARRVTESPEPFGDSILGPVAELYRQSIHWSLLALAPPQSLQAGVDAPAANSASAWSSVDAAVPAKAVPDPSELAAAQHAVDSLTFHELGTLPVEEQAKLSDGLRRLALALISEVDLPRRVMEALWIKRAFRLGLLVTVLVVGVGALAWGREARERSRDLAQGRPWRASSFFAQAGGCKSPLQECPEGLDYFFHTQDEPNAWVEFDLGSSQRVSGVRVVNRRDCCAERAVPLVVEVSSDRKTWKAVARRDAAFSSWLGEFAPVEARWVRLRSEKRGHFHLAQVRILR